MTRKKILGLLIGASLLIGYEPVAEAMPVATPSNAVEMSSSTQGLWFSKRALFAELPAAPRVVRCGDTTDAIAR